MKKLILGLSVIVAAISAQASYLLWQVNASDYSGAKDFDTTKVDSYKLYAVKDGAYELIDNNNENVVNQKDLTGYESYSFYVELANYNSGAYDTVARSETVSYANLTPFMQPSALSQVAQAAVWHAANYSAAPEPTSALLVMMGVAFLGLKRRKA